MHVPWPRMGSTAISSASTGWSVLIAPLRLLCCTCCVVLAARVASFAIPTLTTRSARCYRYELKAAQGFPIAQRNAAFLLDKLKADGQGTARFVGGWGALSSKRGERRDVVHPGLRAMARVACGSAVDRAQRVHVGARAPAGAGEGTCAADANEKMFATLRSRAWMSRAAAQGSIDA